MVVFQGLLVHHLQRVNLAQVKMRVDKGFGYQVSTRLQAHRRLRLDPFCDRGDSSRLDANIDQPAWGASQLGLLDNEIVFTWHRLSPRKRFNGGRD